VRKETVLVTQDVDERRDDSHVSGLVTVVVSLRWDEEHLVNDLCGPPTVRIWRRMWVSGVGGTNSHYLLPRF
jgi:hypothetical protein